MKISNTKSNPVTNGNLVVSTDFITGVGTNIKFINDSTVQARVPLDPADGTTKDPKGYDYYFHIKIKNKGSKTKNLILEALRPDTIPEKVNWFPSQAPVICSLDRKKWYLLPNVEASEGHRDYRCSIEILPGEKVYIANNTPINPSLISPNLKLIANKNSNKTSYYEIGRSINGYPISLLQINEFPQINRDRFLIWAGIHPSEPDPLAAFWAINWILSNEKEAINIRKSFIFDIVPMINPDGFDIGTSGCNAKGVNIFWDFRTDDLNESPESTALWNWIKNNTPQIALDLHAYIYQIDKPARPYISSITNYSPEKRRAAIAMHRAVIKQCNGEAVIGGIANAKNMLSSQLPGTLSLPGYHLNFRDGPEACKKLTISTLISIMNAMKKYQPIKDIENLPSYHLFNSNLFSKIYEFIAYGFFHKIKQILSKRKKYPLSKNNPIDSIKEWENHIFNNRSALPLAKVMSEEIN